MSAVHRVINFPLSDVLLGKRIHVTSGYFIVLRLNPA